MDNYDYDYDEIEERCLSVVNTFDVAKAILKGKQS